MPKKIVRFCVLIVMYCGLANGAASTVQCPFCTKWNGHECVHIPGCTETDPNKPIATCKGTQQWDFSQGKCVCNLREVFKLKCDVWQELDTSDDVCNCVSVECPSGQYPKTFDSCQDCPMPDFAITNGMCNPASDKAYATYKDGLAAFEQAYTGCYLPVGCVASDETGVFELDDICLYTVGGELAPLQ